MDGRDSSDTKSARPIGPSRLRRLAKKLALLACTLLVMAVCAEVAVRLLTDTVPPLIVKDPVVGRHYEPGFESRVYVAESDRKILLRFNDVGFRGPNRPIKKPDGVCRVAVLGDSMIASVAVEEEDTMVCRLEKMLNRSHPQVKWEVLNFGVSGSSPGQELVLYRELVRRFDPDVVLCAYFVGNDLADNSSRLSNNPRIYFDMDEAGKLQQLPFSAERANVSYYLNRYSRFYVWQKQAVNHTRHNVLKQAGMLVPGQWIFSRKETPDVAHAWRLTDTIHREFQREVIGRGGQFAVVMIPSAWQIYEDVFQEVVDRAGEFAPHFDQDYPDERLGELCRQSGVPLLSMTDDFRKAAPGGTTKEKQQWLFLRGTGHFNERGGELAAKAVHRFLTTESSHLAPQDVASSRGARGNTNTLPNSYWHSPTGHGMIGVVCGLANTRVQGLDRRSWVREAIDHF